MNIDEKTSSATEEEEAEGVFITNMSFDLAYLTSILSIQRHLFR